MGTLWTTPADPTILDHLKIEDVEKAIELIDFNKIDKELEERLHKFRPELTIWPCGRS